MADRNGNDDQTTQVAAFANLTYRISIRRQDVTEARVVKINKLFRIPEPLRTFY